MAAECSAVTVMFSPLSLSKKNGPTIPKVLLHSILTLVECSGCSYTSLASLVHSKAYFVYSQSPLHKNGLYCPLK
jgi:hypothetical protein